MIGGRVARDEGVGDENWGGGAFGGPLRCREVGAPSETWVDR